MELVGAKVSTAYCFTANMHALIRLGVVGNRTRRTEYSPHFGMLRRIGQDTTFWWVGKVP